MSSGISPTIYNRHVALLRTVALPPSVGFLAYADDLVLSSHGSSPAHKLQKVLNPPKFKTMAFNTYRQGHEFKLGLQYLKMVNNYKYPWITIDRRFTFAQYVAETNSTPDTTRSRPKQI